MRHVRTSDDMCMLLPPSPLPYLYAQVDHVPHAAKGWIDYVIGLAHAPSGTAERHVSFSFAASLIYFFRIQHRSFRLILVPGNSAAAKHHVYCFLSSTSSSSSATSVNQRPPRQVQHRRRPSDSLQVFNRWHLNWIISRSTSIPVTICLCSR
jgi:hypothetical protein